MLALRLWAAQFLVLGLYASSSHAYMSSSMLFRDETASLEAVPVFSPSAGTYKYERFWEVQEACGSVLSAATSELKLEREMVYSFQNELTFYSGDWNQSTSDGRPLMPFDELNNFYRLASFSLTDVDTHQKHSPVAVNVSGFLTLSITTDTGGYGGRKYNLPVLNGSSSGWHTSTMLEISMEGVYIESNVHGGLQRVMCLLGKAVSSSGSHYSRNNRRSSSFLGDDKFLLILRYPMNLTLTTRAIRGELTSLHKQTSSNYFDKIIMTSQLGPYSNYQFGAADDLVSKACTPYPYQDQILASDKLKIYRHRGFCRLLDRFASGDFVVVPNWKCSSTDQYCHKLGPFYSNQEVNETDGGFQNVRLLMQDVRCQPNPGGNGTSARVSAYYRAVPSSSLDTARQRTGLDGTTLAVEGKWDSASGQLCMVGCLGPGGESCDTRVCLYFSFSFSISQRNIITGSISPIDKEVKTFFPLSFEKPVSPEELRYFDFRKRGISYEYTKFKQAFAFLDKSEPFDISAIIKKAVLKYPRKQDDYSEDQALYLLADDLTFETVVVPDPLPNSGTDRAFFRLGIFTVGTFVRGGWWMSNATRDRHSKKSESTEGQLLLNVSASLDISGESYRNVSMLSLEGIYDPFHGRLFLIACRDVRASWKILSDSGDLENGLDCSITVKIEYPPINMRWMVNQIAKICIESQRTTDDPLYFSTIKLQTHPILFHNQQVDILSRKLVEGILQVSSFSVTVGCIISQLFYSGKDTNSVPYISLSMLGVQAFGYSIPLITGAEALFSGRKYRSYSTFDGLGNNQSSQLIDYLFKILVLAAFLLTLRLGQKVWKSRVRLVRQTPSDHGEVPDEKLVFLTCLAVHSVGFLAVLAMHITSSSLRFTDRENNIDSKGIREWHVELEEYAGLVQDFFLLPQVIGNFIWRTNCVPLRKAYCITLTFLRILPHIYDYVTAPTYNPYLAMEFEFANPIMDFYSKFDDIAIPIVAILLLALLYLQQQRSRTKLFESFRLGHLNIFQSRSRTYEKIPTVSEAELVPSVNVVTEKASAER